MAPKQDYLSDEPLAELSKLDPASLLQGRKDDVGRFMIALASVYNDLRDLTAIAYSMRSSEPPSGEISPRVGEWRGRRSMLLRFSAGVLHELMVLIEKNKGVLQEKELKSYVESLPSKAAVPWREVVKIALGGQGTPSSKILVFIRNTAAFHYYGLKAIDPAWDRLFGAAEKRPENSAAYYSVGNSMEGTRFYFADAVRQSIFRSSTGEKEINPFSLKVDNLVVEIAQQVNFSLFFLLDAFLKRRTVVAASVSEKKAET